ncbi:hypothetical protein [Halobacteriovorax sp.]|uniref:hypothetical protein n=1 Tax=Halobacteriovorax sp. TaxID=2020862 RepID=UPI00356B0382
MNNLNDNGFSMVQIMMAAGMMGILSLGMMKMMENQKLSVKSLESSAAAVNFYTEAKAYLGRPGYCSKNFEGIVLEEGDAFELDNILKANGDILYEKGQIYESGIFRLESISTKSFEKDTETSGLMQLRFKLDKVGKSYGAKSFTKILKLSFSLDENGKVLSCSTLGSGSSFSFEGSQQSIDAEQGVKDLQAGVKSEDSKKVEKVIESNPALKEMRKSLETLRESNKKIEEMLKD